MPDSDSGYPQRHLREPLEMEIALRRTYAHIEGNWREELVTGVRRRCQSFAYGSLTSSHMSDMVSTVSIISC
jgi:hypothetical protein